MYRQYGFSLTELSVSLAIIGLIAASAISVAITNDYSNKLSETENKLDRIEEALVGFLTISKRLPCPADGSLALDNTNFGLETLPNSTSIPGSTRCASANRSDETIFGTLDAGGGNIYMGVIPVTTLQLPDEFMFDGWGNRISYIITHSFANNETTNTACDGDGTNDFCFIDEPQGRIIVLDESGTARTPTTPSPGRKAVYALISHGPNGHGAYPKGGGTTRKNAFATGTPYTDNTAFSDEVENAHFNESGSDTPSANEIDDTIVMRDYIEFENATSAANRRYFDDIVRFKTKSQVVHAAGKVVYDSICRDASTIIDSPLDNACSGADDEDSCLDFATEIDDRCL